MTLHQTQRNWDWTRLPTLEHVAHINNLVENFPTKLNYDLYNCMIVYNQPDINCALFDYNSQDYMYHNGSSSNNGQLFAPLLYVFNAKFPLQDNNKLDFDDSLISMGAVAGAVAAVAHSLGYHTGFCSCINTHSIVENCNQSSVIDFFTQSDSDLVSVVVGVGHAINGLPRGTVVDLNNTMLKTVPPKTALHKNITHIGY